MRRLCSAGSTPERSTRSRQSAVCAAAISCSHPCAPRRTRSRSASWCSTTAATASPSAVASTSAPSSTSADWVKCCASARSCSTNQRWIGVSGTGPDTGPSSTPLPGATVATAASDATVWFSKSSRGLSPSPARPARATIWMLRIESPPSSKKLSSTPTRSSRSTSAQIPASTSSAAVRGATYPGSGSRPGAGSAERSSFPFGVSGSASTTTNADGTMCSGRLCPSWARSALAPGGAAPAAGTT